MSDDFKPQAFRRRSTECQAMRWVGDNLAEIREWTGGQCDQRDEGSIPIEIFLFVEKSGVEARVRLGDWIIAESDGVGFYPCKSDIFAATYEPVP